MFGKSSKRSQSQPVSSTLPARRRKTVVLAAAAAAIASLTLPVHAADVTWDGGGGDDLWTTGANWIGDVAPLANDNLIFTGATRLTPSNSFAADTTFSGLNFNAGSGAFTLSGNSIVLGAGAGIVSAATNAEASSLSTTLAAGRHAITTGAANLNLSGLITRSTGATVQFTKGTGAINVAGTGLANDATGILGGWATIGGTDFAALDGGNNVVAYTGYTLITAGAIASNANTNYKYGTTSTGNLTASTGTLVNTILDGHTDNNARTLTITGTMKVGTRGGIFRSSGAANTFTVTGGTLTANGGGEITFSDASFTATGNNLTIASIVANDGANAVSVNVVGYVVMSAANTFTGGTQITQGRVQGSNTASFGTGAVNVYAGGQAFLNNNGTYANVFNIIGTGSTETNGGQALGAIRMNTGATTISGQINLLGDARIAAGSGATNSINGKISGTGRLEFTSATGDNTFMQLGNTGNDWSGGLLLTNAGNASRQVNVRNTNNEVIPDGAGKGNVTLNGVFGPVRYDLNGFNETINGLASAASANNIVQNTHATNVSTLTVGGNNASASFGGVITNGAAALNIVKTGTGTQTLSGAHTHTGTTTVNGGTLLLNGSSLGGAGAVTVNSTGTLQSNSTIAGAVTVNNGGTLTGGVGGTGQMTIANNLTLGAVSGDTETINVTANAGSPTTPGVNVSGVLTLNSGASNVTINVAGSQLAVGAYTLVDYGTIGGTGFSAFTLGSLPSRTVANLVDNTGNGSVDLNVTGVDFPVWSGALSSEWSTATLSPPKNWVLNSNNLSTTDYIEGDAVLFNDSASGTTVVNIATNVSPNGATFANSTKTYTLTGSAGISGSGGLSKTGTGTLIVTNPNSYIGTTTIASGSTIQVGSGGTSGSLGSGAITNDGTLTYNRSDAFTVANAHGGTGTLNKSGAGTMTMTGAGTMSGVTNINAGTIKVNTFDALGPASTGGTVGAINIASGGQIDVGGVAGTNVDNGFGTRLITISGDGPDGSGAFINSGTIQQQEAIREMKLAANASVGGTGRFDIRADAAEHPGPTLDLAGFTLTKKGTNQFTLVSVDVTDGNIVVDGGRFAIETDSNILANNLDTTSITLNTGTIFSFFNNVLGDGITTGFTRRVIVNGTGVTIGNASGATASVAAPITLNQNVTMGGVAGEGAGTVLNYSGVISESGGARSVTKAGLSLLALSATNTFTGGLIINDGTVRMDSATALDPTNTLTFGASAPSTAIFNTNGQSVTVAGLSTNATPGTPRVGGNGNLTVNLAGTNTFGGIVQDGTVLTKAGVGTLILTGANTHTGGTTINAGTVQVGNAGTSGTIGDGTVTNNSNVVFNRTDAHTVANFITGTGTLNKNGTGTMTLSGFSNYTGDTNVNAGTLLVTGGLDTNSNVIVNSGAILGGTGTVGNVTVNSGGTVTAGTSIGSFFLNNLQINSGGFLGIEFGTNPSADFINVTNGTTFGTSTTLTPSGAATVGSYTVLTSGTAIVGAGNLMMGAFPPVVPGARTTNGAIDISDPNSIKVNVTGGSLALTWKGAAPGDGTTWDTATVNASKNWINPTPAADSFFNNDSVLFDDTATTFNVTIGGAVNPASIVVNASNNYTFGGTGTIGGTGSLSHNGSGTLIVTGDHTFSGGTSIANGTLVVGNGGATGSLGTGAINGTSGGTLRYNRTGTFTVPNPLTGSMNLQVATGTVTFSGTGNNYTGATTMENGTLKAGALNALGNTSGLTLGSGANSGVLDLNSNNVTVGALLTSGTGTANGVTNSGTTLDATLTVAGSSVNTFDGVISDGGTRKTGIVVTGGNLSLSKVNTHTGGSTVNGGGTLTVLGSATLGGAANPLTVGSGLNIGHLDLTTNSATVPSLTSSNDTDAVNNTITVNATKTLTVAGGVTVGTAPTTGSHAHTNLVLSGGGDLVVTPAANENLVVAVGSGNNNFGTASATLDVSGLSNFVYNTGTTGTGQVRVGGLVTRPDGHLVLAATSNNITAAQLVIGDSNQAGGNNNSNNGGNSTVSLGAGTNNINVGTITLGNTKSAGIMEFAGATGSVDIRGQAGGATTTAITIGRGSSATDTNTTSRLSLAGHNANVQASTVTVGNLAGATGGACAGAVTFDTGTFNVATLQLALDGSGTNAAGTTGTFTLGGPTADSAATGVLNVTTAMFLANVTSADVSVRTDTGNFIINGGTANINADMQVAKNVLATGTTVNTTLTLAGGTLNMTGKNIGSAANPVTTLNFNSGTLNAVNSINGTAGVTKTGAGTLKLTGTNNYVGPTAINGGILAASSSANLGNGSATNIITFDGGTLRTDGAIITTRKVTIGAGGATIDSNGFTSEFGEIDPGNLVKNGAGKITFGGAAKGEVNNLTVNAGIVALKARSGVPDLASSRRTLYVRGTLNLGAVGTLDMNDNDFVMDNTPFTDVLNLVITGFGNPTGPGITSSTSDGSQIHALFDNALIGVTDWNGSPAGPNAIIGKYTYFGDANIDGQVTGDDYTVIDANLNTTPPVGLEWLSGDMNLDGSVTGDDYTVIDANLGLGTSNPLTPSALSVVPEPGSLAVVAAAGGLLLGRRRRSR